MGSSYTNIANSFNTTNTTNNYFSPPGYGHNVDLNHSVKDIAGLTRLLNDALNNGLRSLSRLHVRKRHGVEVPSENKMTRDWANNTISSMLQNGMQSLQYMSMMRGLMGGNGMTEAMGGLGSGLSSQFQNLLSSYPGGSGGLYGQNRFGLPG